MSSCSIITRHCVRCGQSRRFGYDQLANNHKCLNCLRPERFPDISYLDPPTKGVPMSRRNQAAPSILAKENAEAAKKLLGGLAELLKKPGQIQSSSVDLNEVYDNDGGRYLATRDNFSIRLDDGTFLSVSVTSPNA